MYFLTTNVGKEWLHWECAIEEFHWNKVWGIIQRIYKKGRMDDFYVGDAMPSSQTYSSSSQFILKAGSVFMKCGSGI